MTALYAETPVVRASTRLVPARHNVDLRCHRNLRGPYTAGGDLLRRIVPELTLISPAVAAAAAPSVAAIAPDLAGDLPDWPRTRTDQAADAERTRLYPLQRTRDLAFTVSQLVREWAQACHPEGVTLWFWELADADPTDEELFAMLRRRCAAAGVRAQDAGAPVGPALWPGGEPDLAQRYISADGTSTDAAALRAYQALSARDRAARHARRARQLIKRAEPGAHLGAIPYHLERGADPREAVTWLAAAQRQVFREGYYAAALDYGHRGRALLRGPDDLPLQHALTRRISCALAYLGRADEAIEVIEEHRRVSTDATEQMTDAYLMAVICSRHGDPARPGHDAALSWANTAMALAGGAPPEQRAFATAFMSGARALVELGRGAPAQALRLADEAVRIAGELPAGTHQLHRAVLLGIRAKVLTELGEYDSAIRACTEVLTYDPELDEAYFDRALAYQCRGDLDAALRDLDRAIELSPAFADAYYNRADIRLELGEEDRALADLDAVLDIDPDHADALLNRAAVLIGAGDLGGAQADLDRGLTLRPRGAELWSALGLLRSEQGAEQAALAAWATALSLNPELAQAYGNRAALHYAAGRPGAAVADLDRAIALRDTAALRANRGLARHAGGDFAAAIRDFDAALAMPGADEADVLFRRGLSYRALGEYQQAAADWARHLRACGEQGQASGHAGLIAELGATHGPPGDWR